MIFLFQLTKTPNLERQMIKISSFCRSYWGKKFLTTLTEHHTCLLTIFVGKYTKKKLLSIFTVAHPGIKIHGVGHIILVLATHCHFCWIACCKFWNSCFDDLWVFVSVLLILHDAASSGYALLRESEDNPPFDNPCRHFRTTCQSQFS